MVKKVTAYVIFAIFYLSTGISYASVDTTEKINNQNSSNSVIINEPISSLSKNLTTKTEARTYNEQINPRIVLPDSDSPVLSYKIATSKPMPIKKPNVLEEGTDFGSVTSSEAEFTDTKEDIYLSQVDKINDTSDEKSINNESLNASRQANQEVEQINNKENTKTHLKLQKFHSAPSSPTRGFDKKVCNTNNFEYS